MPVSSPRAAQARSRAWARAARNPLSSPASMPSRTRQIVAVEATGPCRPGWSARAWTSLIVSAPSAIATATSTHTRPGSCPDRRDRSQCSASDTATVNPATQDHPAPHLTRRH